MPRFARCAHCRAASRPLSSSQAAMTGAAARPSPSALEIPEEVSGSKVAKASPTATNPGQRPGSRNRYGQESNGEQRQAGTVPARPMLDEMAR